MNQDVWRGQFGDEYTDRNQGPHLVPNNIAFFVRALAKTNGIGKIIEFGAGSGLNIRALRIMMPNTKLTAIEVNERAASQITDADLVLPIPIQDYTPPDEWMKRADLAFTKGVLIHIPDADLFKVYDKLYASTNRYILIAEYHSPRREEVLYRGLPGLMWKGPYAEEFMKYHNDRVGFHGGSVHVIDYGFVSKTDRWPQDDLTFFLLEKR